MKWVCGECRGLFSGDEVGICIRKRLEMTFRDLIQFKDLTVRRKTIVKSAMFLALIPGLVFIVYNLLTNIEGPNPFLMAALLTLGMPTLIVGILMYLIADNFLKRKLILGVMLILFQISVLPILWGINDLKVRVFLSNNQTELELIANNVLDNKWTCAYAKDYASSIDLPIQLIEHIEEDKTVLFHTSGMIDNCHGIAYTRTGNEATRNNCGELVNWEKLKDEWYEWGTT